MRGRFESSRLAWRCNFSMGRACTVFFRDVSEIRRRRLLEISGDQSDHSKVVLSPTGLSGHAVDAYDIGYCFSVV